MAETNTRQASRAPVTLKIKFKSETLDQFIERYSVDISHGGIFIRTKDPLKVGTALKFEFQLKDATPLIAGEGTVVWTREPDAKRAGVSPGMGVRFDKLPGESQKVLDAVLAKKGGKLNSVVEPLPVEDDDDGAGDFVDSPTRVAPAGLVDSLVSSNDYDDGDLTPLPKPMPFHGDVDEFNDEAFNESTKVASLDSILAQAKDTETDESPYDEDEVFASTSGADKGPPVEPEKASAPAEEFEDPFADLNDEPASPGGASDTPAAAAKTGAQTAAAAASSDIITSTSGAEQDDDSGTDLTESSVEDADDDGFDDEDAADDSEHSDDDEEKDDGDDDDDDDDEELDDDDDGINPRGNDAPPESGAARAAVLEPPGEDEQGSSMPWIAVAAVILLIGGVGGFWLLNKGDRQVPPAADRTLPAAADPSQPPDAATGESETVEAPEVPTRPIMITTVPEGARLSVEGTELQALSPATFDLESEKSFTVHVQHDAFLSQDIEVGPESSELEPIKLVAKPKLIRITSQPPGAIVTVNGQRLRGRTPVDLPVSKRMAAMPNVRVQLRLPGYLAANGVLPMTEGFEPTETELVSTFSSDLKKFEPRPKPANNPASKDANGASSGNQGESTGPAKEEPAKTEPVKTEPAKAEPAKTEPAKTEPAKTEPAKTEPAKTEPKASEPSQPTPDWMK